MNRGPADLQGSKTLNELWERYKGEFAEWLSISRKVSEKTREDYLKALNYFFVRYTIRTGPDIKKFLDKEGNKRNIANGLRVFLTFLAERDYLDYDIAMIIKKRFIRARPVGVKRIYITDKELREAYEEIKKRGFKKQLLFELLVFTGLRLSHVVELMNTYEPDKLYIVNDKIARYPLMITDRGNKKAYWAYMPLWLARKLTRMKVNYKSAQDWPQHGKVSAATIRKWFTTFLARHGVSAEVIDFIQGRAPRSVLERHYLNLTVLADEAYSSIVEDLEKVLEGSK